MTAIRARSSIYRHVGLNCLQTGDERSVSSSPFILAAIAVINGLTAVLGLARFDEFIGAVIDQPVI